jgi:hypothetical protein
VGARHGVRAVDHFQFRRLDRFADCFGGDRKGAFHRGEALGVVVADAVVFVAIIEIVTEDERALRVEVRSLRGHQVEFGLRHEHTVLDLRAAGERCGAHRRGAVGVNDAAQPELLCLAAHCRELFVSQ